MKKTLIVILTVILTMTLAVSVFGTAPAWSLSEDNEVLSNGVNEYRKYHFSSSYIYSPRDAYVYPADLEYNGEKHDVSMPKSTEHIAVLGNEDYQYFYEFYVTEEGRKLLDEFLAGDYGFARIQDFYSVFGGAADISVDLVEELDNLNGEEKQYDVMDLQTEEAYQLLVYDKSDSVEHIHGMLYEINGEYWYINYDALDNTFFDASGYFSYRSGTVNAKKVPSDTVEGLKSACAVGEDRMTEYYYADGTKVRYGVENLFGSETVSLVFFWVFVIIAGFVFPLACAVLGIVLASSKKTGNHKRWLTLTALALVMLIISFVIVLILILP